MNRFRSVLCTAIFSSLLLIACATDVWAVVCIEKCVPITGRTEINFDVDSSGIPIIAPNSFQSATLLTDLYKSLGVLFSGPSAIDGGAILSDAKFQITALTRPNFLAFNSNDYVHLQDQVGHAFAPETITFLPAAGKILEVSISARPEIVKSAFSITAYDSFGNSVTKDYADVTDWTQLSVAMSGGIGKVVLTESGDKSFMFDSLSFLYEKPCNVPEPDMGILTTIGLLGLLAVGKATLPGRRRQA